MTVTRRDSSDSGSGYILVVSDQQLARAEFLPVLDVLRDGEVRTQCVITFFSSLFQYGFFFTTTQNGPHRVSLQETGQVNQSQVTKLVH